MENDTKNDTIWGAQKVIFAILFHCYAQGSPEEPPQLPKICTCVPQRALKHARSGPNLSKPTLRHPKIDPQSSFSNICLKLFAFRPKNIARLQKIAKRSFIFATISMEFHVYSCISLKPFLLVLYVIKFYVIGSFLPSLPSGRSHTHLGIKTPPE